MRIVTLLALVVTFGAMPALHAQTGGVMVEVYAHGTNEKLGRAAGAYTEDYYPAQHFGFDFIFVRNSNIFYDGEVYATAMYYGYDLYSCATDYIPIHRSNVQVFQGTLTRIKHYHKRPVLSLVPAVSSLTEGGSVNVTFTLKDAAGMNVSLKNELTLNLSTAESARLSIPASVTIPIDTSSVTFVATATDNAVADGNVIATITGTRGIWGTCSTSLTVVNND